MPYPSQYHDLPVGADPYRRRDRAGRPGPTTAAAFMAIFSGTLSFIIGIVVALMSGNAELMREIGYSQRYATVTGLVGGLAFGALLIGLGIKVLTRSFTAAIWLVILAIPYSVWAIVYTENAWLGIAWVILGSALLLSENSRKWMRGR